MKKLSLIFIFLLIPAMCLANVGFYGNPVPLVIHKGTDSPVLVKLYDIDNTALTAAEIAALTKVEIYYTPASGSDPETTNSVDYAAGFDLSTYAANHEILIKVGLVDFTAGRDRQAELIIYNATYTSGRVIGVFDMQVSEDVEETAILTDPITGVSYKFKTISVAGQDNVVADSGEDTLTFIAGDNITITTDATNDSITITASGGAGGSVDTSGTPANDDVAVFTDADTIEGLSESEFKALFNLEIGTDVQAPLVAGTDYLAPDGDGSGLSGVVTTETDPDFASWLTAFDPFETSDETDPAFNAWLLATPPLYSETDPTVDTSAEIQAIIGAGVYDASGAASSAVTTHESTYNHSLIATALQAEVDGSTSNEIQTIDVFSLSGTTLQLSLSSDGEATKEIDLSSLQDGTGTDNQTAPEVSYTNTTSGLTATDVQAAIDEVEARVDTNDGKVSNISTALSIGTKTATTMGITSDGGADDVVLPEADTDYAGLLGADKFDEIVANSLKVTFPGFSADITTDYPAFVDQNTTYSAANEASATTCFPLFNTAATGEIAPKTNAGLTFNSATGVLAANGFSGPLTGNVTGDCSGSSGSCTGNAATATTASSGDSATSFFSSGTIEHERGGLEADVSAYDGVLKITGGSTGYIKYNFGTSASPTVNDDVDGGWSIGSKWYETDADEEWTCLDSADGAAVWRKNRATAVNAKGLVSTNQTFDMVQYGSITMTVGAAIGVDLTGTYVNNRVYTTELVVTDGGAYTITWAAKFKFVGGTAPTLTASGRDTLTLITRDGGTTCDVFVNGKDVK